MQANLTPFSSTRVAEAYRDQLNSQLNYDIIKHKKLIKYIYIQNVGIRDIVLFESYSTCRLLTFLNPKPQNFDAQCTIRLDTAENLDYRKLG